MSYKEIQVNKNTQVCGHAGHWFIIRNGQRVTTSTGLRRWWTVQSAAIAASKEL